MDGYVDLTIENSCGDSSVAQYYTELEPFKCTQESFDGVSLVLNASDISGEIIGSLGSLVYFNSVSGLDGFEEIQSF